MLSGKLERGVEGGALGVLLRFGVEVARLCEKDEGMWFVSCSFQTGVLQMLTTLPFGLSGLRDQASGGRA